MATNGVSIGKACRRLGISEKELRVMMADGRLRYRWLDGGRGKPPRIIIDSNDIARVLLGSMGPLPPMPPNSRMQLMAEAFASTKKSKRSYDILHTWTGQDLRAKGYFRGICKNVGSQT